MDMYGLFFIIQLLVCVGIILAKVYNFMTFGKWYDMRISFILFIGYLFSYLLGLFVFFLDAEELLYLQIFRLESFLLALNVLFLFIEIIFYLKDTIKSPYKAYNATEYYANKSD
mgnify:CR=1 FL=1